MIEIKYREEFSKMEANILSDRELSALGTMTPADKYKLFREKYTEFIYEKFLIDESEDEYKLSFVFHIPGLSKFVPTWTLKKPDKERLTADDPILKRLVFSLGLVELISYWKIACPKTVRIKAGKLCREQAEWWKSQYLSGLGEFFYRNEISVTFEDFMAIESDGPDFTSAVLETSDLQDKLDGCLIPVGGGKDSIVTLNLLSDLRKKSVCYVMNSRGATDSSALGAGYKAEQILNVSRTLDQNMLELNKQGYLNGHTPFSALVAFSGVLMAELYGKKYVVLSNESSANESTVAGSNVNHQYSKSFQFEADFDHYIKSFIGSKVQYFSILRPWSEFQIAAYFSSLTDFHSVFRSCNAGSKTNSWCGKCAKCLFVALLLTPFLSDESITDIFGRKILEDAQLVPILNELCGLSPEKPFECVGSREEISTAMMLGIKIREKNRLSLPYLLTYFKETDIFSETVQNGNRYFDYYQEENLLPPEFDARMRSETAKLKEKFKELL